MKQHRGSRNTALHEPTETPGLGSHHAVYQWNLFPTGCIWRAKEEATCCSKWQFQSESERSKNNCHFSSYSSNAWVLAQLLTDLCSEYDKDYIGKVHSNELSSQAGSRAQELRAVSVAQSTFKPATSLLVWKNNIIMYTTVSHFPMAKVCKNSSEDYSNLHTGRNQLPSRIRQEQM